MAGFFLYVCIVASAFMVILSTQTMHALLFLVICFFNVMLLLMLVGAEFVALLLIILYVGALAILFVFTVMLLNVRVQFRKFKHVSQFFNWRFFFVCTLLVVVLAVTLMASSCFSLSFFTEAIKSLIYFIFMDVYCLGEQILVLNSVIRANLSVFVCRDGYIKLWQINMGSKSLIWSVET